MNFLPILNQKCLDGDDLDSIRELIENDIGIDQFRKLLDDDQVWISECGDRPFHLFARFGKIPMAKWFASKMYDFNYLRRKNNKGACAIHIACQEGHTDFVKFCLSMDASIANSRDRFQRTPLIVASQFGQVAIIDHLLVNCKADLEAVDFIGRSALMSAAVNRQDLVCLHLISKYKVNLTKRVSDEKGYQFVHMAVEKGLKNVVTFLLEHCVTYATRSRDLMGNTPLMLAMQSKQFQIIQLFLDTCNESVTMEITAARNDNGFNFVHIGASVGFLPRHKLLTLTLLNSKTLYNGDKAIHLASKYGHFNIIQILINKGVAFDCANFQGQTPLMLAKLHNQWPIVNLLILKGASICRVNVDKVLKELNKVK